MNDRQPLLQLQRDAEDALFEEEEEDRRVDGDDSRLHEAWLLVTGRHESRLWLSNDNDGEYADYGDEVLVNVSSGRKRRMPVRQLNQIATVDTLGDEVLLHIFSFLPWTELLRCALVCRRWYEVSADDFLWQGFFNDATQSSHPSLTASGGTPSGGSGSPGSSSPRSSAIRNSDFPDADSPSYAHARFRHAFISRTKRRHQEMTRRARGEKRLRLLQTLVKRWLIVILLFLISLFGCLSYLFAPDNLEVFCTVPPIVILLLGGFSIWASRNSGLGTPWMLHITLTAVTGVVLLVGIPLFHTWETEADNLHSLSTANIHVPSDFNDHPWQPVRSSGESGFSMWFDLYFQTLNQEPDLPTFVQTIDSPVHPDGSDLVNCIMPILSPAGGGFNVAMWAVCPPVARLPLDTFSRDRPPNSRSQNLCESIIGDPDSSCAFDEILCSAQNIDGITGEVKRCLVCMQRFVSQSTGSFTSNSVYTAGSVYGLATLGKYFYSFGPLDVWVGAMQQAFKGVQLAGLTAGYNMSASAQAPILRFDYAPSEISSVAPMALLYVLLSLSMAAFLISWKFYRSNR